MYPAAEARCPSTNTTACSQGVENLIRPPLLPTLETQQEHVVVAVESIVS